MLARQSIIRKRYPSASKCQDRAIISFLFNMSENIERKNSSFVVFWWKWTEIKSCVNHKPKKENWQNNK